MLYYENKNFGRNISIVPTSAHTGEGIPDMLMLLVKLTQERMADTLMYLSELECTVLEVKVIEGLGTTIDVILSNGVLHEGDRIVLCGLDGPIITNVRALLTPEPMKEMRVKSAYVHHKEVKAALGVKITAQNLGNAIAGSRLLVVGPDDDEDDVAEEVMGDLHGLYERVAQVSKGVFVQASTLGSLEALLEFLKTSNIPVSLLTVLSNGRLLVSISAQYIKRISCDAEQCQNEHLNMLYCSVLMSKSIERQRKQQQKWASKFSRPISFIISLIVLLPTRRYSQT